MNKELLLKFMSEQGYKKNSPDVDNPINVIPSNRITMKDVEFPVKGVDNQGNEKIMIPGEEYQFPGDYVIETPIKKAQKGIIKKPSFEEYYKKVTPMMHNNWDDRSHEELKLNPMYKKGGRVYKLASDAFNTKKIIELISKNKLYHG